MRPFRHLFMICLLPALATITPAFSGEIKQAAAIVSVAVLDDAMGEMSLHDVRTSPDWRTLPGQVFAGGFTRKVHWLRLSLQGPADEPLLLTLLLPTLDDVRIYLPEALIDPGARVAPTAETAGWGVLQQGDLFPFALRERDWRGFSFGLRLPDLTVHDIYLRVDSTSSHQIRPEIWREAEFNDYLARESALFGLLFGSVFILMVLGAVYWRLTRERLPGYYLILAIAGGLYFTSVNGFFAQFVFRSSPQLASDAAGMVAPLFMVATMTFFQVLLDVRNLSALLFKILGGVIAYAWMCFGFALLGIYALIVKTMIYAALAMIFLLCGISFLAWWRRHGLARYALPAYGLLLTCYLSPLAGNLGLVTPSWVGFYGIQIGTYVNLILLLPAVVVRAYQVEAERRQATEKALLEKREAESQRAWVAMMTHEIKTPLTLIDMSRQNIEELSHDPKILRRTDKIKLGTRRIHDLVERLLRQEEVLARLHQIEPAAIELTNWLPNWIGSFDEVTQKRLRLSIATKFNVYFDPELLEIALNNLVMNAIKYGPEDGFIVIAARPEKHSGQSGIMLSVIDNGRAIEPTLRERVFERHHSMSDQVGNGIGLWACREIAYAHGGEARLSTGEVKGNEFSIWLPVNEGAV